MDINSCLPDFNIIEIADNELDIQIRVKTNFPPLSCPHCGCVANLYKHDKRDQLCVDLPVHGKRARLHIKRQRYKCRDCNQTFWERLDHTIDEKRNCTKRLVTYIGRHSLKRSFTSIAEDVGISEKTVRNIFRDYINELEQLVRFETPRWLGIDEIHMIKPRCVIANVEERTIVDMLQNRNKESVAIYLLRLPDKERITHVTMDMRQPYKDAVRAVLPKATIIVDKFHVVRMANQAMETIRKQIREDLTRQQRRGLMHDRFILLKRHKELTDMEKATLDLWTKNYPSLGTAYSLKESFFDIWESDSRQKAFLKYHDWKAKIPKELQPAFEPLTMAVANWEEEIFSYFDHRITNAYAESLNSLTRVVNRIGRGYSFEALRAKILFTEGVMKQSKPKYVKDFRSHYAHLPSDHPHRKHPPLGIVTDFGSFLGADISTLIAKLEEGSL